MQIFHHAEVGTPKPNVVQGSAGEYLDCVMLQDIKKPLPSPSVFLGFRIRLGP